MHYTINHLTKNTTIQQEQKLVLAAQQNVERFGVLYDLYHAQIFRYVYSKVGNQQLTADLTSQVFLKAMLGIKKYQFRGIPFAAWLYRIASNEVNMYYRKAKKEQTIEINEQIISDIIDDTQLKNSDINQIKLIAALNQLTDQQTHLIDLRFFEKLSFMEIGAIVGITTDNAKTKVYRVLKKLKAIIESNSNDWKKEEIRFIGQQQ